MSNFEYYLGKIASNISSPNNPIDYNDFVAVKDYIFEIMSMENSYFGHICRNDVLFGSAAHNVRLNDDDEFDVLMELRFPAYSRVEQVMCKDRPGFMFLDFSDACLDNIVASELANNNLNYLNVSCLRSWLDSIFRDALDNFGNVVNTDNDRYRLKYIWRGITFTIYARSRSRSFSIDFVPAVKIIRNNSNTWHAIPKPKTGYGNSHLFTYMLSNTQAEVQQITRCGQTMKGAIRLLQALRDVKELKKLRCFHIISAAIWMVRRMGLSAVRNLSLSDTFLILLDDLSDAFIDGHLPSVWNSQMNLLENFNSDDLSWYTDDLCSAYNTLKTYPHQPTLSFARCQKHFE